MKKLITFRFDPVLLEKIKRMAQVENRTVTNFVETVLKRSVEEVTLGSHETARSTGGRDGELDRREQG